MSSSKVIVFGPTGGVGRFVATTAAAKGAHVVLAMRNTTKPIPGLSAEEEKAGKYTRVQADLTQPDTVTDAIKQTGAKRAFFYLDFTNPDGMRPTVEALKAGGIEFVVFLSSYTILRKSPSEIKPEEMIPFAHAQVEISLEKVFGRQNFVALRPGGFATNSLMWYGDELKAGNVKVLRPDIGFDSITPENMGAVGGTILVDGPKDGQEYVFLFGPKMVSQGDAIATISKTLGRKITVTEISQDDAVANFKAKGLPPPLAEYLGREFGHAKKAGIQEEHPDIYSEGLQNVEKYTGQKSMGFESWVQQNKALFD